MGSRNATSVAPLIPNESAGDTELACEQPRDFHFAVTWVSLFAHLDLIETTGPRPRLEPRPATLSLVPVVASPQLVPADHDASAAWEMVVPKMIRTGPRTFVPAEAAEPK